MEQRALRSAQRRPLAGIRIADAACVRYEYRRFIKDTYPEVASLRVTVRHHGDLGRAASDLRTYTKSSLPRALVCLNPRCTAGGYDLTATLDETIRARTTSRQVALECSGHDGVPRGRGRDCPCGNSVQVDVDITYAAEDEALADSNRHRAERREGPVAAIKDW